MIIHMGKRTNGQNTDKRQEPVYAYTELSVKRSSFLADSSPLSVLQCWFKTNAHQYLKVDYNY